MHHVRSGFCNPPHDMRHRDSIAWSDVAAHRDAGDTEGERWCELSQNLIGAGAACVPVGNQSDEMAAGDLFIGQIEHMPEQATDRCAEHVQDLQGSHRLIPNWAAAAAMDDDKLSSRIERIPTRVWTFLAGLGVDVVNKR
jgi:hypothetical protein